jgi:hypothetical protein
MAAAEQVTVRMYKAQNIVLYEFAGRASPLALPGRPPEALRARTPERKGCLTVHDHLNPQESRAKGGLRTPRQVSRRAPKAAWRSK